MRRHTRLLCLASLGIFGGTLLGGGSLLAQQVDIRQPVPEASAQEESLGLIREVYREEYTNAKTVAEKAALAVKLLRVADQSKNDATGRYVLLRVARDLAAQAGDIPTVLKAIEQMGTHYAIDTVGMKSEYFVRAAKEGSQPSHHKTIIERAPELVDEACAKDDYASAGLICRTALISARKLRDTAALTRLAAINRQIDETEQAYASVQQALPKLQTDPADAEANAIVGRFYCFNKNAWDKGLPLLALGTDDRLKQLAEKELAGARSVDEKVALGDAWWNLAEQWDRREQEALRRRAGFWYRQAQDGLPGGLVRVKVTKRLEELAQAGKPAAEETTVSVQPGEKLPRGEWVEVLDWVDVEKDQVHAKFQREGSQLKIPAARMARIMLPVATSGSYELEVEFARTTGVEAVTFILPVGNTACAFLVSGQEGDGHGFEVIDGRTLDKSPAAVHPGTLSNKDRHTLLLRVGVQGEFAVLESVLDRKPCVRWTGKQRSLNVYRSWALSDPKRIGLGSHRSEVIVYRVRLRLHSGEAVRLAR